LSIAKSQQNPQFFQDIVGCAWRRFAPSHDRADVLALHLADEPMTDVFVPDEALDHELVSVLRGRREPSIVRRLQIKLDKVIERSITTESWMRWHNCRRLNGKNWPIALLLVNPCWQFPNFVRRARSPQKRSG